MSTIFRLLNAKAVTSLISGRRLGSGHPVHFRLGVGVKVTIAVKKLSRQTHGVAFLLDIVVLDKRLNVLVG